MRIDNGAKPVLGFAPGSSLCDLPQTSAKVLQGPLPSPRIPIVCIRTAGELASVSGPTPRLNNGAIL